jgi:hypothetical protein
MELEQHDLRLSSINTMNERIKNGLGLLGDLASVLTVPAVLLCWFTIKQEIALNRTQSESAAKDAYVPKTDFTHAVEMLSATDVKLADAIQQDHMNIQHLTDIISTWRDTFAGKPNNQN